MTNTQIALITGITGQDGAYLAEFLLNKGYEVHGLKRRTSLFNTDRIDHLYQDRHEKNVRFFLHHGDMTDSSSLIRIIQQIQPDEIYNLAAQSHVAVSFEEPEYTANSDALGVLRVLEAIRILGLEKKTRFYQASTSELYGLVQEPPQMQERIELLQEELAGLALAAELIKVRELRNLIAHEYATEKIQEIHAAVAALSPVLLAAVPKVIAYARNTIQHYLEACNGSDLRPKISTANLNESLAPTTSHKLASDAA